MTENAAVNRYEIAPEHVRTLLSTFWATGGWRQATHNETGMPTHHQVAAAIRAGIMFDAPEWSLTHDEAVGRARDAVRRIDLSEVSDAFLASLGTRRLDVRSALGSYAVLAHLPKHKREQGPSFRCGICGLPDGTATVDRNILNFERFKWGGVRRDDVVYATFDLLEFSRAPKPAVTPTDVQTGHALLRALADLPATTTAPEAAKSLSAIKGNKQEREVVLDILGVCGVVETTQHRGYGDGFVPYRDRPVPPLKYVERVYPVCWWRASNGVNQVNVRKFLPRLAV